MKVSELRFIDPATLPEPDQIAVGTWTCGCGGLTVGPMYCTVPTSLLPQCELCGEIGEVMCLPMGDKP